MSDSALGTRWRRPRWTYALAVTGLAVVSIHFVRRKAPLIGPPLENLNHFVIGDDAFYYLQIAFNWSHGLGSTFDGIRKTNGYQPLWQWLLVGLASGFDDKLTFVHTVQWVVVVLHLSVGWALFATLARRFGPASGLLAGFLWILAQPIFLATYGMESGLYALLLCALHAGWSARASRAGPLGWRVCFAFGLWVGLVVLARLDALLLVPLLGLVLLIEWSRGLESQGSIAAYGAGLIALLGPYFVGNRCVFGAFLPVSVVVKSLGASFRWSELIHWSEEIFGGAGFPNLWVRNWNGGLVAESGAWAARAHAIVTAMVALVSIWVLVVRAAPAPTGGSDVPRAAARVPADLPFLAFLLLHWVIVASGRASTWSHIWHFVPEFLAMAVLPAVVVGASFRALRAARPGPMRQVTWWLLASALVVLGLRGARTASRHWDLGGPPPYHRDGWVMAVEWINANLPPQTRIGSWDSGFFGYFLKPTVLNLDGRVADLAFVKDVLWQPDHYVPYLDRMGVTYLLNEEPDPPPRADHFLSVPRSRLEPVMIWPTGEVPDRRVVLMRLVPPRASDSPSLP